MKIENHLKRLGSRRILANLIEDPLEMDKIKALVRAAPTFRNEM
jgi:hypothetical protein